jgi:nucleoporin POM152
VGERIAYTLSGTPPFDIAYDFNGRWNAKSQTTNFRRIAEKPGDFTITSISDKASECRAAVNIPKTIHPLPSVQISRGKQSRVDIHEGNEVDILFEFWGTPPFEFTYTRSSNAKKGQRSVVLETRHDVSYEHSKVVKASQEGTYEVVAIKDKFCSFSTQQVEKKQAR